MSKVLETSGFSTDESRSNPMVVAIKHSDCPIDDICVFIVAGFGSVADKCNWFRDSGDAAECMREVV